MSGVPTREARERHVAYAAAVALGGFYFLFRPANHMVDTVLYALGTEVKDAYVFFHWHHLLYTPLNWVAWHGARAFGWGGSAFTTMSAVSAAAAAGAALVLYLTFRRLGVPTATAAVVTAGAAFANAWWYFAGEGEVLALISFFLAGAVFLLAGPATGSRRGAVALGLWLGVGTLFHQTLILFLPVAAVLTYRAAGGNARRWGVILGVYAAVVVPAYILIPVLYYGVGTPLDWLRWTTSYAWWGDWGRAGGQRLTMGLLTLCGAFVAGPDPFDASRHLAGGAFLKNYVPALAVAGGLVAVIAAAGPRLARERRRWLVAALLWFVLYHLFFSWWEPENMEWWIGTTLPLWLLAGLAFPRRNGALYAGVAVIGVSALINFNRLIYPATLAGKNDAETAGYALAAVSRPRDAIFISHVDTWAWTDYFTHHTRNLSLPFNHPGLRTGARLAAAARRGFAEFKPPGRYLYFTDYEWDDPSVAEVPNAAELRAVFFRIIRGARPIGLTPFPGRPAVIYRFTRYADALRDVKVYEADPAAQGEGVILGGTGEAAAFDISLPERGEWVICIQARGRAAGGAWPKMRVAVDGHGAGEVTVDADYWAFYELSRPFDKLGPYRVTATFLNDFYDPETKSDRDLFVNRLIMYRGPADK